MIKHAEKNSCVHVFKLKYLKDSNIVHCSVEKGCFPYLIYESFVAKTGNVLSDLNGSFIPLEMLDFNLFLSLFITIAFKRQYTALSNPHFA